MFSALRQGSLLYILEKGENPNIKIGQVEGVTQPRFAPGTGFGTTVVDITVKVDNENKDFIGVPSGTSVHGYGNVVISESREAMVQEVNAMLRTSKSALESIDYHRKVIDACEDMLKQIDPEYAKQQERDDTIDSLKDEVGSLKEDVNKILKLLTKADASQSLSL